MTLELHPEVAAGLETLASAHGMSVEDYLREHVERELPSTRPESAREEAVRRMLEFGEKHHLSLGEPITRQFLHEGHRY